MAELNAPARSAALLEDRIDWRTHAGVVSWGAVFAGAVAAAAFGLILLTLGTGLGLAALSPWHTASETVHTFGVAAIVWVCVTQILTSGLGGYLAGRLRHRWPAVEADEVYFRDTAHGFVTWALATLATAALFAAILPAVGRAGVKAETKAASPVVIADRGDADVAANRWPIGYYIDALFRLPVTSSVASTASLAATAPAVAVPGSAPGSAPGASTAATAQPLAAAAPAANAGSGNTAGGAVVTPVATPELSATVSAEPSAAMSERTPAGEPPKREVTRIFLNSLATGDPLSGDDADYVARIVSRYTGLSPQAAQARVSATYAQLQQKTEALQNAAKAAADSTRRASVSAALWLFVSLLMGAFAASFMAVFGGRLRDV
jgi:hypothetical protein